MATEGGVRLVRSALQGQIAKIAQSALALVTSLLVARSLGPTGVGVYATALAGAGLIQVTLSLGLEDFVLVRVPWLVARGRPQQALDVAAAAARVRSTVAIALVATAALLVALKGSSLGPAGLSWSITSLAIAYAGLNGMATFGAAVRAARFHALWPAILDTCWYFAVSVGIAVMVILGQLTAFRALLLIVVAQALVVVGYVVADRDIHRRRRYKTSALSVSVASVLWANTVLGYGVGKSLDLLIIRMAGKSFATVGQYNAAFNVFALGSTLLIAAIGTFAQVGLAGALGSQDEERIARSWRRVVLVIALITFPALGFLVIRARDVLQVMYGDDFTGGAAALIILAGTAIPIRALGGGSSQGVLYAQGRQRSSLKVRMCTVTLNAVGALVGLQFLGIAGVALATGGCGILTTFLEYRAACRVTRLPLPMEGTTRLLVGTTVACLAVNWIPRISAATEVSVVVHGLIFLLIFTGLQTLLKPLGDDVELLANLPRPIRLAFAPLVRVGS